MITRYVFPAALLSLSLVFTGCGGEKRVPVVPVSGKVSFGKEFPAGAQLVLHPVGTAAAGNIAPAATVKADGAFQFSSYSSGDGAPPGEYVATVEWFKIVAKDGSGGRGPNVLPPRYARRDTTPVKVTVGKEATQVPLIEIQTR